MFQDEAGFGRINKPKYCWCEKGNRPSVPCHHIREYRYVYGAVILFFIGFLGEYILTINQRVMHRPLVVEEERINF